MEVQINERFIKADYSIPVGGSVVMITPPLDEEYWLLRAPVSDDQAIVGFPKFGTIGIGFQVEEDRNTNLPYTCGAEEILDHISHNKGDGDISDALCLEAIRAVQQVAADIKSAYSIAHSPPARPGQPQLGAGGFTW